MPTANRRVATYLPSDVDELFKAFVAKDSKRTESGALLLLIKMALGVEPNPCLIERIQAVERSIAELELEVRKINEF